MLDQESSREKGLWYLVDPRPHAMKYMTVILLICMFKNCDLIYCTVLHCIYALFTCSNVLQTSNVLFTCSQIFIVLHCTICTVYLFLCSPKPLLYCTELYVNMFTCSNVLNNMRYTKHKLVFDWWNPGVVIKFQNRSGTQKI